MTSAGHANPEFWNRLAASYAKQPIPDAAAYETTLERVRSYLTPQTRALEVGCGTGTTALRLAPHLGHLLATDVSPKMIEIGQEKARVANVENVEFRTGTLNDEWLQRESFDVVAAFNLIHLLEDIPGAIRRAAELLVPGGLLITKTPCVGEKGRLLRVAVAVMRSFGKAPFVNFVTGKDLEAAIAEAGLSILERGVYPVKTRSLFLVARKN